MNDTAVKNGDRLLRILVVALIFSVMNGTMFKTFGLILFAFGSFVGMLAFDYWMVVLGRVLQASGAGVLPATAMIIPTRYFAPEKRGRALGTSAIGLALGSALGPIIAGLISNFGSWRLLFVVGAIMLALFIVRVRAVSNPFNQPEIFANRSFS
ncbi:MFS transporter [Paenibacillus filicis]|uniref:MFS transporter n=1 Tax=Paenibacillus gyeongsangnamensis TaxID=3388067 RepID=A0ABT4Q1Y8_9BACL|nr:MFS transporter [Paenibacillus filicis]MCZ8510896.1 MFS transporter [Paenibacillus filicis]